ncbi:MAG: GNAT family N-acetyltransferase [Mycobacterium leprae]
MNDADGREAAFLLGTQVYLRPFEASDLTYIQPWNNDPTTRGQIGECHPTSRASAEAWLAKLNQDRDRIWFAVVSRADQRVVGEAGLLRMYYPWRTTDMTMIIGDKAAQGKGYGSEAVGLLLDYAFGYLNFHRVSIGVVGFNEGALRFWKRAGFREEGIQRDGYYYDHKYHDFVMLSILEEEYRAARSART